jgi:class 3 adenylate cyclase/FixJ family two-component response regulator
MRKPVILCVDDEQIVLSSLKQQLKRHFQEQYNVEAVDNGEEALAFMVESVSESVDVPVVISDQIMPGMKGDQMLGEVHKLSPRTRNILLTGQADADAVGNAVNYANLFRYIPKPWEQNDLLMSVGEAAHGYFQDKRLAEQTLELQEMNRSLADLNQELQKRLAIFYRFVPNQFLNVLGLNEYDNIERGHCIQRNMSVMFTDIRNFTNLAEKLLLEESFRFINSYYSHVGPAIRKYNGFIDKYIGDAIMALYETADDAVLGAVEMLVLLEEYNAGRKRAGYVPIQIGIGINTGELILGTVGEEDRIQTTVIGDIVNLSARMEGLTKRYGTPILITECTQRALQENQRYVLRLLDHVNVRGKSQPITLYEVLDTVPATLHNPRVAIAEKFSQAVRLFHDKDTERARQLFSECLNQCEHDYPCHLYLDRIQRHNVEMIEYSL